MDPAVIDAARGMAARFGRALLQATEDTTVDITWEGGMVIASLVFGLLVMAFDLVRRSLVDA